MAFVESAPRGSLRALTALAAPESLNDELALHLVTLACPNELAVQAFVSALHMSGFLVERNSEWHISSEERTHLGQELLKDRGLFSQCHEFLAALADGGESTRGGVAPPVYLRGPVGRAYHHAALNPQAGLALYREASAGSLGQQWLAARLANEQQDSGLFPAGAIEPAFLRGMVLYREGRFDEAMRVLRPIAYSNERSVEVAIAAHLVGQRLSKSSPREAERLLRRSLAIGEATGHRHHQAQVLHTLGQHLRRRNPSKAERLLRRSLNILEGSVDRHGQAQVLHTLGQHLKKGKSQEAERLLRRSLGILEAIGDRHGQAQVLHTLGLTQSAANPADAEDFLRRSLAIGEEIRNERHQAIALLSLGRLLWPNDPTQGRVLMLRSLELDRRTGNAHGEAIVLRELQKLGIKAAG